MEEMVVVTHPSSDFEHLPRASEGLDTHKLGPWGLIVWWSGLTLLFKGLTASVGAALGKNNPNALLLSSFPLLCIRLSLCVLFPTPVFLFFNLRLLFGGVRSGFCRSPRVVPALLQNSSSSASSEASETCQSVSECSSPTSVSSGSTMGAWASTEKVTNPGPSHQAPLLPAPALPAAHVTGAGTWKLKIYTKSLGTGA